MPDVIPTERRWELGVLIEQINVHYAFLILLPFLIFLINPNWLFQGFGHMDPWYYFGQSIDFPRHQHIVPEYSGERLTWILPARLFVALLSPVYGWGIFHLCVYSTSVLCIYSLVRSFAGTDTALLTAALMACHPLFLGANGWTYVDSGSIMYLLLAFTALVAAAKRNTAKQYLILGGAMWAAASYNYLLWWVLTPCCAMLYWASSAAESSKAGRPFPRWPTHLLSASWFSLGIAITTGVMAACHGLIFGATSRSFYWSNILNAQYNLTLKNNQLTWGSTSYGWIATAGWLVFPALTFVVVLSVVARHFLTARSLSSAHFGLLSTYAYAFLSLVYFTVRSNQILQFDYYASILIPFEFLIIGIFLFALPGATSRPILYSVLVISLCVSLIPLWRFPASQFNQNLASRFLLGAAMIGGVTFTRHRIKWAFAAVGLAVVSIGLIPAFPSNAWNLTYNGLAAMQRIAAAIEAVDAHTAADKMPALWIDYYNDPFSAEYRAIMCGLESQGISMWNYPQADATKKYAPGTPLVLITRAKNVFEEANRTLASMGMPLRLTGQSLISGPAIDSGEMISYWLTFTEVLPHAALSPRDRETEGGQK